MELGKEEFPQKTRMIVFRQKIITVDNKETVVIASRRSRKIPVTRRDEFLWAATSKKQAREKRRGKSKIPVRLQEISL